MSLRSLIVLVAFSSVFLAYTTTYYRLSGRGIREAQEYGLDGFLYVPFAEAAASEDLSWHYVLAAFYEPLSSLDRNVFGTPSPWISVHWRLGG